MPGLYEISRETLGASQSLVFARPMRAIAEA
jgi:hypothetical protein